MEQQAQMVNKSAVVLAVLLVAFFVAGFFVGFVASPGKGSIVQQPTGQVAQQQQQPTQPTAPSRIQVGLDDDAVLGDANAPVTIIEFSDMQCPFCGRFYTQTLPQIKSQYIDTGKAKLVFRDFPLSFHPYATPAAIGAECAKEQGKFWEYHDTVFETQNAWVNAADPNAALKQIAADLGLNTANFNSCYDAEKYAAEVQKDFNDGQAAGVSGTPTFYVGSPSKGYVQLVGAQPFSTFKTTIDQELAAA
jgi:protein-disulfide isomerase